MKGQMKRVRTLVNRISAELEPDGGAVEIKGATKEELRAFIRETAAATWALGLSMETAAQGLATAR